MGQRVAICMPVGPQGICPATVHTLVGVFYRRAISDLIFAQSHVVPGRNMAWKEAVKRGCDRVIWLDSDVSAPADDLLEWGDRAEGLVREGKIGCVGTVVARRGGGWNFSHDPSRLDPLWLGLGLVYWHVPKVLGALAKAGRPMNDPFRWIPPNSEDYEISGLLHRFGCWQALDAKLPTAHDGVGTWAGAETFPGYSAEASVRGKRGGK